MSEQSHEVDAVVAAIAPVPNLDLVAELECLEIPFVTAGDAVAPRTAMQAFREGDAAARSL
jgi:hypothetical protein